MLQAYTWILFHWRESAIDSRRVLFYAVKHNVIYI
jgi:hypothetical protein